MRSGELYKFSNDASRLETFGFAVAGIWKLIFRPQQVCGCRVTATHGAATQTQNFDDGHGSRKIR